MNTIRGVAFLWNSASIVAAEHANGICRPDPALQPLISIHASSSALSGVLMLGTSPERNLIALMKLIPEERAAYTRLIDEKESLLRDETVRQFPSYVWPWWGRLPACDDLPDVDLALLDQSSKRILFLELKWFVEPAEARETVHRTDDLAKGVKPCNVLLEALAEEPLIQRQGSATNAGRRGPSRPSHG